jgi:hypothetical protein
MEVPLKVARRSLVRLDRDQVNYSTTQQSTLET